MHLGTLSARDKGTICCTFIGKGPPWESNVPLTDVSSTKKRKKWSERKRKREREKPIRSGKQSDHQVYTCAGL